MEAKRSHKQQREAVRQLKYNVISLEKRMELIQLVVQQDLSIYEASKMVGINNATAKDIIKKYRREGKVFIRKAELRKLQSREEKSDNGDSSQVEEPLNENQPQNDPNVNENEVEPPQMEGNELFYPSVYPFPCWYYVYILP